MKAPTSLLFIVSAGPEFGLGHLRRMQAVARAYRKTGGQGPVEFYLLGCSTSDLAALDHDTADGHLTAGSSYGMAAFCLGRPHDVLMVDVHKNHIEPQLFRLSQQLQLSGARLVAIDHVAIQDEMQADVRWVPSFFKDPAWPDHLDIQYGWDHYLIEKRLETAPLPDKNRLLVLTGGSDAAGLGAIWPRMLEEGIGQPLEIHWVQGPFSKSPAIPELTKHKFILHHAPKGLDSLINSCDWVLTVHGISVFETLIYGRVCVVFNPYPDQNRPEMMAFEQSGVAGVVHDHNQLIAGLAAAFTRQSLAPARRFCATGPDGDGAMRLLERVASLVPIKPTKTAVV
jgi:spore coat polysaccharide biosynthesis predicted glycosyltransferase SpsG